MKNITTAIIAFLICTSITAQNVGIGTTAPNYPLTLRTTNPAQPFGLVQTNGTDTVGLWVNSVYGWLGSITNKPFHIGANNQPNQLTVWPNGNVGLGTLAMPTTKLEINGKIKITDGNQAAGKVLTSDANGEAKWETPSTAVSNWTTSGANIYNNNIGNVGIGTNTPQAPFTVAPNKTVLFGADTLNGGTKMMWLPSKGAFRGGILENTLGDGIESDFWNPDSVGLASFAFGYNVKAKGNGTISMGAYTTASGITSVAMGNNSKATGNGAIAMGSTTTASGPGSISIGTFSAASGGTLSGFGTSSISIGNHLYATGNNSVAIGDNCYAVGHSSKALGSYATASGYGSTVLGNYATASGYGSSAFGEQTKAQGIFSLAMGFGTDANSYNSTSLGRFNDTIVGSNRENWIATDPLVTLGNGIDAANRHNALTIYKNGNHDITGYTRLGEASEGAVRIKTKKLTGTTAAGTGNPAGVLNVAHGLVRNKILSVSIIVRNPSYVDVDPNYTLDAGYEFQYQITNNDIVIINTTNGANIANKAFSILITYEE